MNTLRDKIAEIVTLHGQNETGRRAASAILELPEIANLQAKLAEAEANINLKADWIEATIDDMSANEEATEAALFRAYQMGLNAAIQGATACARETPEASWLTVAAIRDLTPPADLVARVKGGER